MSKLTNVGVEGFSPPTGREVRRAGRAPPGLNPGLEGGNTEVSDRKATPAISRMKRLFLVLFVSITALLYAQQNDSAPRKFALVIGNGAYSNITRLENPVNDANDMAAVLSGLGFSVDKVLNGTQNEMESAIIRLRNELRKAKNSYGFLFYAGHGVQSNGENFLIPVDANIPSENFLRNRSVSVQEMLDEMNDAGNELNVVVLDACRDNPFSWKRSGNRGFAVITHQPADSIIVFATSAGSTAADGIGRNGLFTGHLLNRLQTPDLEVTEVFRLTMGDVARASNNQQRPAVYNQFSGLAYLGAQPAGLPAVGISLQPIEMIRINGGTFTMGSPLDEPGRGTYEVQHQVTVSAFYMGKYEVTQKEWYGVMGSTLLQQRDKANPEWSLGEEEDNYPMYYVSWFEAVEFCNKLSRIEALTPAYTINGEKVTWNRNANGYRLPTEAEWEFACRAGTATPYSSGTSADSAGWYSGNSGNRPHPVGEKQANQWGLYDMHGNVTEWCWDWYGPYPNGAETDPAGASFGSDRVIRGGSASGMAQSLRSARRGNAAPTGQNFELGFRVARNGL